MKCKLCGGLLTPFGGEYGQEWASGKLSSYHVECLVEEYETEGLERLTHEGKDPIFNAD